MKIILLNGFSVALILLASCFSLRAQETEMTIATYNIRYDNPGDAPDTWDKRFPVITNMVKFHGMDIFGIQEAMHHQVTDLADGLSDYSYVGVGRDDGAQKGEYSAIFYNKDEYKVLEDDTFWLSEDTTKPNKGWDAALPRVCTWAKIEEVETGKQFYVFNTHFDHRGVQARINSAALIMEKAKEIAGGETVILTGDFNIDQDNEAYKSIKDSDMFNDSYEVADIVYANNGTFNSFDNTKSTDRRIDHIFVTEDIKVKKYGILTDTYHSRFPSDHFPVLVKVVF
ncbi:MAG: endonuclease/exonuclease/phosphatase family protein [Anditalea sp.]